MIKRILAVARRELAVSSASPSAWVFLMIFLVMASFCTFVAGGLFASGQADLAPFFDWMPWLFLLIVPALAMPMWSEERRVGVFELTLSFPSSIFELVAGKYTAGMAMMAAALFLTLPIPLTAMALGDPDTGAVACGYAGAFLLGGIYLAMSTFCSAVSKSQTASFLLSVTLCGFFLFTGWPKSIEIMSAWLPPWLLSSIAACAFLPNYQAFQKGVIDTGELVYALSLSGFFISVTCFTLEYVSANAGSLFAPGAFSDGAFRRALRKFTLRTAYAAALVICVNIAAGYWSFRFDASGDNAYSISAESKAIASEQKAPVTLRFYASLSDPAMPQSLKKYAERVKWLLREFVAASHGNIRLTVIDPEQDSADEEAAVLDGIKPLTTPAGDRLYLGVAASYADSNHPVPYLSPQREGQLEYDIARIVRDAAGGGARPKLGIMSPFEVLGRNPDVSKVIDKTPENMRRERPWYSLSELAKDFELYSIPMDTPEIPDGLAGLVVIHPSGIMPRTLYALDQYVMRGGRMAVFLDPHSFYAALKTRTDYSMINKLESSIDPLAKAWGVTFRPDVLAADMNIAYRKTLPGNMITRPTVLSLTPGCISKDDPVTGRLNSVLMYFSGFFDVVPVKGIKCDVLLHTTKESQIVSSASSSQDQLVIRSFKASGTEFPLAVRLTGKFKTAYPSGAPEKLLFADGGPEKHLAESTGTPEILLFGDSDMLFNDACEKTVQDAFGEKTVLRINDNVTLFQNAAGSLAGQFAMNAIRSRVPMSRPLTKINELKASAELAFRDRILRMERELMESRARLEYLRRAEESGSDGAAGAAQRRAEQRKFKLKVADAQRELKELRSQLKNDLDRLETRIKMINMVLVPALVGLCGIIWSLVRLSRGRRRYEK